MTDLVAGDIVRVHIAGHPDADKAILQGWIGRLGVAADVAVYAPAAMQVYEVLFHFRPPSSWCPFARQRVRAFFRGAHLYEVLIFRKFLVRATHEDLRNFILEHELTR